MILRILNKTTNFLFLAVDFKYRLDPEKKSFIRVIFIKTTCHAAIIWISNGCETFNKRDDGIVSFRRITLFNCVSRRWDGIRRKNRDVWGKTGYARKIRKIKRLARFTDTVFHTVFEKNTCVFYFTNYFFIFFYCDDKRPTLRDRPTPRARAVVYLLLSNSFSLRGIRDNRALSFHGGKKSSVHKAYVSRDLDMINRLFA